MNNSSLTYTDTYTEEWWIKKYNKNNVIDTQQLNEAGWSKSTTFPCVVVFGYVFDVWDWVRNKWKALRLSNELRKGLRDEKRTREGGL